VNQCGSFERRLATCQSADRLLGFIRSANFNVSEYCNFIASGFLADDNHQQLRLDFGSDYGSCGNLFPVFLRRVGSRCPVGTTGRLHLRLPRDYPRFGIFGGGVRYCVWLVRVDFRGMVLDQFFDPFDSLLLQRVATVASGLEKFPVAT